MALSGWLSLFRMMALSGWLSLFRMVPFSDDVAARAYGDFSDGPIGGGYEVSHSWQSQSPESEE
ncbi:MAG: hypothetical protein OXI90_14160 [Gammaproteobacteria bacterium]|nr:hypothetical protein [Gammaproteobacteria bacterium]